MILLVCCDSAGCGSEAKKNYDATHSTQKLEKSYELAGGKYFGFDA